MKKSYGLGGGGRGNIRVFPLVATQLTALLS